MKVFSFKAQRLERLRKERQNQIKCKNIQWKERSSSQSGTVAVAVLKRTKFTFSYSSSFLVLWMVFPLLIFVADDLSSLFEKKDFKDRPRSTGSKSTLSLRLEQCPQQLNNPFNEYSKFDGKVSTSVSRLSTLTLKGLKVTAA